MLDTLRAYRPSPVVRAAVAIAVALLVILLLASLFWWDEFSRFVGRVRRIPASDRATDNIKAALVAMGSTIFGATAIGTSVSIFFIGQNVQRLHYVTFKRVFSTRRIVAFVLASISLGIGNYTLAAVITPANAFGVAAVGGLMAALFTATLLWFFLSSMTMLDPKITLDRTVWDCHADMERTFAMFEAFLAREAGKVEGKSENDVVKHAKTVTDELIGLAGEIRTRADSVVEELVPMVAAYAKNGDYSTAEAVCGVITDACVNAVTRIDYMFVRFHEALKLEFEDRLSFDRTFARMFRIAREAAKDGDTYLHRLLVDIYAAIARETAPGRLTKANGYNTYITLYEIRETVLRAKWDDRSEPCTIALNAYAGSVDAWTKELVGFSELVESAARELTTAALDGRGGNYTVERALTCLVALLRRAWALPVRARRLTEITRTVGEVIKTFAAHRHKDPASPKKDYVLDVLVESIGRRDSENLFKVIEEACDPYFLAHYRGVGKSDDVERLTRLIEAYLELMETVGETIAGGELGERTREIAESTLRCLRLATDLHSVLPTGSEGVGELDALIRRRVSALPDHLDKMSATDNTTLLFLTHQCAGIALPRYGKFAEQDVIAAVVEASLVLAARALATRNPYGVDACGHFIGGAALLAPLDQSGRSLKAIVEAAHTGLWARYAAAVPDEAAKTLARLSPADEAAFLAFDADAALDTSDRKRIVKAVGFDRVQSVLGEIAMAFGTAPPDEPPDEPPDTPVVVSE